MSSKVHAYSDIFIRYLLGDERNTDLLLSFINAVNEDYNFPLLKSVTIKNPFNLKDLAKEKESVIDIKAQDERGRLYDIEVQVNGSENFKNRSLYYWAKLYSSQIDQGDLYTELKPTVCINLLNFNFLKGDEIHSCFTLKEIKNPELNLTDHILLHFIELKKFFKDKDFSTSFERWLAFFKYEGQREDIMEFILKEEPTLQKAHDRYQNFTRNDELMEIYEARMKWQSDYNTGMAEAEARGEARGKAENKIETAKKMLSDGMTSSQVSKYTGLSIDQVENMKNELR